MFYVLFLESDRNTVYKARKFASVASAQTYLSLFLCCGSINCMITSEDLQTIYFKTF